MLEQGLNDASGLSHDDAKLLNLAVLVLELALQVLAAGQMAIYLCQVVVGEDLEVLHLLASLQVVALAQDHHLLLVGGNLGKAGLHRFERDEDLLVEAASATVGRRSNVLLELVEAGEALLATRRE